MINALTVDVEDYFQVNAFARNVNRDEWDNYPLRVVDNTLRVLNIFDEYSIKATFFVLGWVARRCPGIVKRIHSAGHEVSSHGFGHDLIYKIGPERFRTDIRESKALLESLTGSKVNGYRAPSYSITDRSRWALEILVEEGYVYDSSIFPVYHDTYGIPGSLRFIHRIDTPSGPITEFPLTTLPLKCAGREFRLPIAGGGYLRLFPWWLLWKGIKRINNIERQPAVVYFHPWEIDPEQPRINAPLKSSFRHYLNLHRTEGKLRRLFPLLKFSSMTNVLTMNYAGGEATA